MPDLTCLYQINVQARSLGKQFLTNARKYVPNEKKRGREMGVKTKETKQTKKKKKIILKFTKILLIKWIFQMIVKYN